MKTMTKWLPLAVITVIAGVGFAASPKMTCTLTGKEAKMCCCEQQKNGKLFCRLAKKEVDRCCCKGM